MITTWLTKEEGERYAKVSDKELNELLQEVRFKFSNRYFLQETIIERSRGWFLWPLRSTEKTTVYSMYVHNQHEYQVFNFPCAGINTTVTKDVIMTYFYGLLNGWDYADKPLLVQVHDI